MQIKESPVSEIKDPKKNPSRKYKINLLIIFLVAIGFTLYTLLTDDNLDSVITAFSQANVWMIGIIIFVMFLNIFFEGIILFILARLYTTRYNLGKSINNYFIGIFFRWFNISQVNLNDLKKS
jgi:uncharacterized membrane protein YbhN (UPF0104 family)